MDNNMNFENNQLEQQAMNSNIVEPQPISDSVPNMEPQPVFDSVPNMGPQPVPGPVPNMGPQPVSGPVPNMEPQPVPGPVPNMGPQPVPNMNQQPMNQGMSGEVPVINIEQSPTEVFGQQVNASQPNDPTQMNQMIDSINMQQQPEVPKYGYATNEQKPDLNADSNINLKVVIFIAIIIFGFIMALPYLSNLMDKQ